MTTDTPVTVVPHHIVDAALAATDGSVSRETVHAILAAALPLLYDRNYPLANAQKTETLETSFEAAEAVFDRLGATNDPDVVALLDQLGGR